ncbi:hypothetical protein ACFX2C_028160 [Malus domestica]
MGGQTIHLRDFLPFRQPLFCSQILALSFAKQSQKRSWVYRILCCSAFCSHLAIVGAAALRSCSNLFYPTRDNEAMA